jgi:FkbM family methyltransferase
VVYANPPETETLVWSRYLQPDDWFIEVGASIGVYSIIALEQGAQVTAFEPNQEAAKLFRENMALNGYKADLHEKAVSNRIGTLGMTSDLDVSNHLLVVPDERSREARTVPTVTLDSVIGDRTVAGVKLDAEGAERLILEGAQKALSEQRIRLLQVEWNYTSLRVLGEDRTPIADILRDAGYRLLRPDRHGRLTCPVSDLSPGADVFAEPVR